MKSGVDCGPNVGGYLEDLMRTCVHAEQTPYVHIDLFKQSFFICVVLVWLLFTFI